MTLGNNPLANTVIFSLNNGLVWAHLPNGMAPIPMGDSDTVIYMMRDFLAQCDLGGRLGNTDLDSEMGASDISD